MTQASGLTNVGRAVLAAVMVVGAGGVTASTEQEPRTLTPTRLEAFAAQPDARTTWSKFIGRLDGGVASAIITAVAFESAGSSPQTMRGVRIELRHEGARPDCNKKHLEWSIMCAREQAAVYIEEGRLEAFRTAVLNGRAEVHAGHSTGVTHIRSSALGTGILISGYNLYGPGLNDLAALLADASAQLKTAPR